MKQESAGHRGRMANVLIRMALLACLALSAAFAPGQEVLNTVHEIREGGLLLRVEGADAGTWFDLEPMLKDQLTLSGNTTPSEPLADDLAFFTRQHYLRTGWPKAEVRWELQRDAIFLAVLPGYQIRVGDITWTGDVILPEEELRKFLLRLSLDKEGADKLHPVWVDSELEDGVGFVQRRIRAEGFLEAMVIMSTAPEPQADGHRDISVTIKAGPRFTYGAIHLSGSPPELDALMLVETRKAPGTPFSEASVQNIERRLTSIANDHGYLQATTTSHYILGTRGGTVDVDVVMDSKPRVRIATVTPHPNFSRGSQRVLRAGFRSVEGNYYSSEELDLNFRRVLDTGMFARLDMNPIISPTIPGEDAYADLRLTGEETKPKTLGFEVGFDTFLGALAGVTYRNTNFRDTGDSLAAELRWSSAGPLGSIKLTDPAIFNTQFGASVQLLVENFQRFEYSRYGAGLNLELTRRVSVPFSYTLFAGASGNTVSSDALTSRDLGPTDYTLTTIGASMTLDFRDSPVLPTKGWYVNGRIESSVDRMGSVSFTRTDLRGAWYYPITKKLRFSAGGALMSIQGASVNEVPIDSRVFNGGPNTVRSFSEREMGPRTPGGTPLGGTAAFVGSAELGYEIYKNLEFAVFSDVGSLSRRNNSSPFQYSSDLSTAVGVGFRYRLPFGPIRLDYGHNLSQRLNEPKGTLHLTLGFAF